MNLEIENVLIFTIVFTTIIFINYLHAEIQSEIRSRFELSMKIKLNNSQSIK